MAWPRPRTCSGQDLRLNSEANLRWIFWAFLFAYAIFGIPSALVGDVFGPKKTLIFIVLWWSLFTAITGFIAYEVGGVVLGGLALLLVIQFLFGMGEAGAFPNITRALHNWMPFAERGFAQGAVWMSGRLMGGLTPLVWLLLTSYLGFNWREVFWLFGGIGLVWCVLYTLWFRNRPEEKASVNKAELALIHAGRQDLGAGSGHVPWLRMLTSTNLWALCLMYFCMSYAWWFSIMYLPTFLQEQRRVPADSFIGSIYKGGPLILGAVGCLLGGWLTDKYIRWTNNRKWGRRLFGIVGHSLCAVCWLACLFTTEAFPFALAISLAAFFNDLPMGAAWSSCQDIGKRCSSIVAGAMNTIGNIGGALASLVTGYIIEGFLNAYAGSLAVKVEQLTAQQKILAKQPAYQVCFVIYALVYVVAVLLWLRINSTESIVPEDSLGEGA